MFRTFLRSFGVALALAACGAPPHDAAFDPASPLDKLARGEVRGTVGLENESDASQVSIVLADAARRYEATTDKAGAFVVQGVVPGRYVLTANARYFVEQSFDVEVPIGGAVTAPAVTLAAVRGSLKGSALAKYLSGRVQSTAGGVMLVLRRTASLRGAAGAPGFRPAAAAGDPGVTLQTFSDGDGNWEVGDVPAGTYDIDASYAGVPPATVPGVVVDGAGEVEVPAIVLEPLTGYFDIVGTQDGLPSPYFTTASDVTLKLAGFNANQMKIGFASGGACSYGAAVSLQALFPLRLPAEGENTVCVRFVSATGEETGDLTASILYDATRPVVYGAAFVAQGGYVDTFTPVLQLTAADDNSGLKTVQYAASPAGLAAAPKLTYQPSIVVPLDAPGTFTYYVRVGDVAGNYADPVSATVTLDTTPPALSTFTMNGGAAFTTNNFITADTTADATAVEMQISESSVFSGAPWFPYRASVNYALSIANGAKTVYARVRDPLGRTSNTVSAGITLDSQAPAGVAASFAFAATKTTSNPLTVAAADNVSAPGALQMRIAGNVSTVNGSAGNVNAWIAFATSAVLGFTGTGAKAVTVEVRDQAGNVSPAATASIVIDTAGPSGTVTLLSASGGNRHAVLGWTAVNGAAYYVVEAMKGPYTGTFAKTEPDLVVTTTAATFTGLLNAKDYAFRVRSYDAVGNADTAYSNVIVAPVGTAQRGMSWPGITQTLLDFKVSGGVLSALVKDSNGPMAVMRSEDNGESWSHKAFSGTPYHAAGALAATPSSLLGVYIDSGGLRFQYSGDGGSTYNTYQLATLDFAQYSYKPAVALDGKFGVVVGGKISGTAGRVDLYWSRTGNGGAYSWDWSTPALLTSGSALFPSQAEAAVCVAGPRARIVYRIPNGGYQYLRTMYTSDYGVNWTAAYVDSTASATFAAGFQCQIDALGTSYVVYRRTVGATTVNRLWVDQQYYYNAWQTSDNLPTTLPGGASADFVNMKLWVNQINEAYLAAQDANTGTLWLLKAYLGDYGWSAAATWEMRQIDSFSTAGSTIALSGEGLSDARVLYEVSATDKIRLYTPLLPAPTAFKAMLQYGNNFIATWTPPRNLTRYTVYTGTSIWSPMNSFETTSDVVSYPNANAYQNAVASRDDYGSGGLSNAYYNFPPYTTTFNTTPSGTPARAAMSTDPFTGYVYVLVTQGTQVWVGRITSSSGTVSWSTLATLGSNVLGADVEAINGRVWVTYCNGSGLFVRKSGDYGATYGTAVQLYSGTSTVQGSTCAIGAASNNTNVTVISDNVNDDWEIFKSANGGTSYGFGAVLYPTCGSGSGQALAADVSIDFANEAYQAVGLWDLELGECNAVFVTQNNWSSNSQFDGLGSVEAKVAVHRGAVYGIGAWGGGNTTIGVGSARGTNWVATADIDGPANHVGGIAFDGNKLVAAYTTGAGLQLATCEYHCTQRTSWAAGTVLPAASTALPVLGVSLSNSISYGVFGASQTAVRHWGNQGPYTSEALP